MIVPLPFRRRLLRLRRSLFEATGSARYSRPALHDLDRKLEKYLDFDGGFFVEAGANDGVQQSNTYYFEKIRNWHGVLIEPIPALANECRCNRRGPVVEAALVPEKYPVPTLELHYAGLMSTAEGALGDAAVTARHIQAGLAVQKIPASYRVQVPARTLSSILDEIGSERTIDLLSLDVEGAEPGALQGLDFQRHAPRFICVEARDSGAVAAVLEPHYRLAEVLTSLGSHCDLLYALR